MHVLLALDGSRESLQATEQLARLPFKESPTFTLVTALMDSQYDLVPSEKGVWLREAEKESAFENFQQAKQILEPVCRNIEHIVERQHPRRLIHETAASRRIDLIVLGARGHSGIHRILLGSTADYVANHAKCSVMIVRPSGAQVATEAEPRFKILLAYDGTSESKLAYQQMCDFNWPSGQTQIHIAMVLERPQMVPDEAVYAPEQIAEEESNLHQLNLARDMGCKVKHSVREALHVGNALRDIAEDEQSNLVFIGGTGKSAIARFFLGSTSRYFLHHAHCTMWVARQNQWDS